MRGYAANTGITSSTQMPTDLQSHQIDSTRPIPVSSAWELVKVVSSRPAGVGSKTGVVILDMTGYTKFCIIGAPTNDANTAIFDIGYDESVVANMMPNKTRSVPVATSAVAVGTLGSTAAHDVRYPYIYPWVINNNGGTLSYDVWVLRYKG